MRYGAMVSVVCLFGVALPSAAQELQPRAAATPTSGEAASGIQVKVFTVRNGDATSRAEMLRLVLGQGSSGAQPLRIIPEVRTNSVVAVGAASDLEIIRAVLARLDGVAYSDAQFAQQPQPKPAEAKLLGRVETPTSVIAASLRPDLSAEAVKQEVKDAESRLKSLKAELERQEALRTQRSTSFSASEIARARLAVQSAEAQLEQLTK